MGRRGDVGIWLQGCGQVRAEGRLLKQKVLVEGLLGVSAMAGSVRPEDGTMKWRGLGRRGHRWGGGRALIVSSCLAAGDCEMHGEQAGYRQIGDPPTPRRCCPGYVGSRAAGSPDVGGGAEHIEIV